MYGNNCYGFYIIILFSLVIISYLERNIQINKHNLSQPCFMQLSVYHYIYKINNYEWLHKIKIYTYNI